MRAKPILSLTLLAAALAMSGTAPAVGLGRLTLQSSLGQPLSAQIELTSVVKEELDSVTARVADSSLYRQNHLAYQGVLSRARVAIERLPNGDAVLKVTTPSGVSEPYLDLLIEVNWASGRVVRAYTFLLDPPGMQPTPSVEPVTPARIGASPAPAAGARAADTGARGASAGGYSVRRGDTLSRIAAETKPANATLDQMLVALFNSNRDAFDGENMNRLRAGTILTVPSAAEAAATAPGEATRTVRLQAADWRAYQGRVAGAAPAAEAAAGRVAAGKIGTTVEEKAPAAVPGRDQLKVSPQAGKGTAGVTAAEEAIARDKALKEAQTRISELEKTLQDLQRALELKGQTGAQLQAQADAAKGKPPEPAKAALPTAAVPAPAIKAPEAPKAPAPAAPPAPVKAPAPKADVAKVAPKGAPSFIDDLMGGTPGWVIGGGALAALAGVAALIAARRRRTVKFEDSIIGGTDIKTNTVFGSTGGGVVNTGENSLATDFSREGLGSIDTDEVDPIAEAEVYLAYGRDAQAEEILKDALRKDSQRQEIYVKLLEIHAQHNKPSAFESVAAELYSVSQGKGEAWQKAVSLGRQLDPNNPMFGEGAAAAAAAASAGIARAGGAASPEKPKEGGRAGGGGPSPDIADELKQDGALDFRFDEDVSISRTGNTTQAQIEMIDAAEREFEESAKKLTPVPKPAAADEGSAAKAAAVVAAAAAKGLGHAASEPQPSVPGDLEFRLDEAERPAPLAKEAARPEAGEAVSPALAKPQAAIDLDKLDLAFGPEHAAFEDATPSVLNGQWQDAATKLDLAKAYQEMGDVEGAREILQEVLHEGDDTQKSEAQILLAKLG
jgi:pilus assembly protein FimV